MTDVRGQRARGYQTTPRGNSWPPLTFSYLRLFESWVLVTAIARIVRADVWGIVSIMRKPGNWFGISPGMTLRLYLEREKESWRTKGRDSEG